VGQEWEDLAAKHLVRAGYRIAARNYRTSAGEIDFVAVEGNTLCFIEVKGRRSLAFGSPAQAVTAEKQRRIWTAAQLYLQKERVRPICRFDVVAIDVSGGPARVEILRGAFEGPPAPRRPR
jgi:putative endonuclease